MKACLSSRRDELVGESEGKQAKTEPFFFPDLLCVLSQEDVTKMGIPVSNGPIKKIPHRNA